MNGPPYPLDRETAKAIVKQAKTDLKNTTAAKTMNTANVIGTFLAGPFIGSAAAMVAYATLDKHSKDEYEQAVKNVQNAKKQYKEVKKYEKITAKEATNQIEKYK